MGSIDCKDFFYIEVFKISDSKVLQDLMKSYQYMHIFNYNIMRKYFSII